MTGKWSTSGELLDQSGSESSRHRRIGIHLRLPRRRAPPRGSRGGRRRQLQQVRPGQTILRQRSPLPAGGGRRERRTAAHRARRRLRPGRRRCRNDRRDLILPRVRLRPAGGERAYLRRNVRRCAERIPARAPEEDHRRVEQHGVRVHDCVSHARGGPAHHRDRPMASRSSPPNTSPEVRTSSTACRSRSCGPSTASASGRGARCATTT